MRVDYIRFLMPGSFFPNENLVKRDGLTDKVPKGVYAWSFEHREEVKANGEMLLGSFITDGPRHIVGKVFTHAEIEAMGKEFEILSFNISQYESKCAIKCCTGNWQPMIVGDVVYNSLPEAIEATP